MKANESPYREMEVVPTPYGKLNGILGTGGVSLRKITEISGQYSVGKSTLAYTLIAQAQQMRMDTLWVDTEYSFDESYATVLGVDCAKLDLIQEQFAETALDATEEWVTTHQRGLVVLDSVGGILPRAEAEKGADGKVIGGQAKIIATFCRKIVPLLAINNIGLIVLNHEFTDIMSGRLKTSGGAKLEYHKSVWLRLKKANKRVMSGDQQIGDIIEAEIRKNKLAPTVKQSCELTMLYGEGFSAEADKLSELLASGEVTKKGRTFFRGETKLGVGEAAARAALKV